MGKSFSKRRKNKSRSRKSRRQYLGGSADINLAYTGKEGSLNVNAENPAYPNTGPVPSGNLFFTSSNPQKGGTCSTCTSVPVAGNMIGGVRHRNECKCSSCKYRGGGAGLMLGGGSGFVGSSWTPSKPEGGNHYEMNPYNVDPQTSMLTNPPLKGGRKRKQKGGTLSNFMTQDLINLGRQFQFGIGSAYNALAGQTAPVNPLPWKDQMIHNKVNMIV